MDNFCLEFCWEFFLDFFFNSFFNSFWNSHGNYFVILSGLNFSAGGACGWAVVGKEKFDLMTGGGGGDKNRSLEARGLRTLALKKKCCLRSK